MKDHEEFPKTVLIGRDPMGKLVVVTEPTRLILERSKAPDVRIYDLSEP